MSPFDLRGPEFLLFYAIFGMLILIAMILIRRLFEPDTSVKFNLTDPYSIAYLRGGANEAIRIATVSLIDRGVLQVSDEDLMANPPDASLRARILLEATILAHFRERSEASPVYKAAAVKNAAEGYKDELVQMGMLPDAAITTRRVIITFAALAALEGVAFTKVSIALERGHKNIGFLILMAVVFAIITMVMARTRLTRRGQKMLDDLKTLFGSLKQRAPNLHSHSGTSEAVLLASVFGIAALPAATFPYTQTIFKRAASSPGSSCGSSCGSSSSSSSSCSSSSCGGGGGCGGCGG